MTPSTCRVILPPQSHLHLSSRSNSSPFLAFGQYLSPLHLASAPLGASTTLTKMNLFIQAKDRLVAPLCTTSAQGREEPEEDQIPSKYSNRGMLACGMWAVLACGMGSLLSYTHSFTLFPCILIGKSMKKEQRQLHEAVAALFPNQRIMFDARKVHHRLSFYFMLL